jgi:hypothetical protein
MKRLALTLMSLLSLFALLGCDPARIAELEEGVATEADVRKQFGEPERIWEAPGGGRTFEYNRNPAGHRNYMITIGPDGKMSALRQVLTPDNFARVQPGMMAEDVRRLLGKPARQVRIELKDEWTWDWRYLEAPNRSMIFTVWFNRDLRVLRTGSMPDPEAPENKPGGS